MKRFTQAVLAAAAALTLSGPAAAADDTIKVGLIASMSGPFAGSGKQIENGVRAYMKQHGDRVAGKKVEIILKDDGGPAPDVAKRLAQELVTRDKVDFIAGFVFTPNALAAAPVATESKTPLIIMNAATSIITTKSPYIARVSYTLPQATAPMAQWAAKNGIKKVYTLVADYGPGLDSEATFKKTFTSLGGEIVGEVRTPVKNPDFTPFVQRIKDAKPQAVFVFQPNGEPVVAFMKAFHERGLAQAGIQVLATEGFTDDEELQAMGNVGLGIINTGFYSIAHDSPENKAFLKAYEEANGKNVKPNFLAAGAYDGMAAIYEVARKLNGKMDGDKAMGALKGMKLMSPRGPITIDPETRDVVQTIYVRKVEKRDGRLLNVEFDKFADVRDPGK